MPQAIARSEIADQLRTLADDLKAAWTEITTAAEKPLTAKDRRKRVRIAWSFAVEAGKLLFQLQDDGAFNSDPDVDGLVRQARTHGNEQGACNEAFLRVIQHRWPSWRPMVKFGAACQDIGLGTVYVDAMRRLAKDIAGVEGKRPAGLTAAQMAILRGLHKSDITLTREALPKSRTVSAVVRDPKTIRKHVNHLLSCGWIMEPVPRQGLILTEKGREAAGGAPR